MVEIIPSILAADFAHLADEVDRVAAAGVTKVQVDVMDGEFVPNVTVGLPVVAALRRATALALDVHLMIARPERYVEAFVAAGADVVTVHVEATAHLHRTIDRIHAAGALAGAALNPATPLGAIEEILPALDVALLMTVDPGFGGQRFIAASLPKIRRLRQAIETRGCRAALQVDGGIDPATVGGAVVAGADQVVAGSAVFGTGAPVAEALAALRAAIDAALRTGEAAGGLTNG